MAQRTINSPGVEIRESDLSLTAPLNVGTNVYVTGFAQQGPLDEVLKITTKQELNQIFGPPTNSSERYFYYTINELLNSPANVYASRLPYGGGTGDGFGSKYSALVYPVRAVTTPVPVSPDAPAGGGGVLSGVTTELTRYRTGSLGAPTNALSAVYVLGQPTHLELTESEYLSGIAGTAFTWTASAKGDNKSGQKDTFSTIRAASGAGMVIYNKSTSTVNNQFEGYYIGVADNTNTDPGSNFNNILDTKTLTASAASTNSFTIVPKGVQVFALSANFLTGTTNSVSEVIENFTEFEIDGRDYDDVVNVGVFKLRKSIYANEAFKLDYNLEDGIAGSINYHRTQLNPRGGLDIPFFVENRDDNSRNVVIKINDNISNRLVGTPGTNADGQVVRRIRVLTEQLSATGHGNPPSGVDSSIANQQRIGILSGYTEPSTTSTDTYRQLHDQLGFADSLYPLGAFADGTVVGKELGNIPNKLERALDGIKNDDIYDIDVVVEGGLGTIHAAAKQADGGEKTYYDEYAPLAAADGLRTSSDIGGTALSLRNHYSTIFNKFEQFVSPPYLGGGRGDCIFIADPLRQIFVQGDTTGKVLDNPTKNFQTDIYWPIRHWFANENTSYAATYGNWALIYDSYSGRQVWAPFSGFAGALMARTDAATFPWFAPAGFTRGLVTFANDIAVNPNQKQRDELYKANINPVANFPNQGLVVFGQKTLSKKSSAFDRINVRRLFLSLERPTKKVSRFFVFEQNTEFTRTRIVNTLTPIFERAKNNEGLYDYLIVCDERNNTPAVIDANELVVDIYIKPTRTAEFILVNFYATRTDANFEELIGG